MKLLIAFTLFLALTNTAYAQELKKVDPLDAKVELRTDWSWAASENGQYSAGWTDDNAVYLFTGAWHSGGYPPLIEIIVYRLAPEHYWRRLDEINEEFLTSWNHLDRVGVSEVKDMPCDAGNCLAFKAGGSSCAGFRYVDGTLGDRGGTQGSDLVGGYYCSGTTEDIASEQVNEILRSIVVKKKKWN